VLPLAFYTTFGKRRQLREVMTRWRWGKVGAWWACQAFFRAGHYQADTKGHYALPILGLLLCMHTCSRRRSPSSAGPTIIFPVDAAVMATPSPSPSPQNGASREESCTDISSLLTPAKSYLSLLEMP